MRLRMNRNLEPPLKVQGHDVVFLAETLSSMIVINNNIRIMIMIIIVTSITIMECQP